MAQTQPAAEPESPPVVREFLTILRLRKWTVLFITAIAVATALTVSYRQTPLYQAQAQVLVRAIASPTGASTAEVPDVATERLLAESDRVIELASEDLGGGLSPDELGQGLTVDLVAGTTILTVQYVDPDPAEAARRADALAQAYLDFRRDQILSDLEASTQTLQGRLNSLTRELSQVNARIARAGPEGALALQGRANILIAQIAVLETRINEVAAPRALEVGEVIERADVPESPSSPNHLLIGLLALLGGLVVGVGAALLRERLDDRIRGRDDLEAHAGASALAVIPRIPSWRRRTSTPLVSLTEPRGSAAEAFRTLRTAMLFAVSQEGLKTVLVTSPHASEGKTSVTANLGVALAQAGRRVLLVSADFRRPRLHRFFGLEGGTGLTDVLEGRVDLPAAIVPTDVPNLRLLATGTLPAQPTELIGSERMGRLVASIREGTDFVLMDATPVLGISDAVTLTPFADAVLFVTDARRTTRGAVAHARRQLDQVDAHVIGAVLNDFDPRKARGYSSYYYRYYYAYRREPPAPADLRPAPGP